MRAQDQALLSEYGEAMLYAHLIEDLLALILSEAAYFHVNGYIELGAAPKKFDELIDSFGRAFPDSGPLVKDLHRLRRIRNKLTHAFVPQVGSDLLSDEGRDQIHAMLRRFVQHARRCRLILGSIFEALLKKAVSVDYTKVLLREDEPFDARVSQSEIQRLLDELDAQPN